MMKKILTHAITFTGLLESVYLLYCCHKWTVSATSTNCSTYTQTGSIASCSLKDTVSETLSFSHISSVFHMLLDNLLLHIKMLWYILYLFKNV